ncbi:methyltransferase domain-containing protein [Burkholderia sp. BCC1630]|uniref:methyltransferase domain-containing protein n=1 Tax=Burkholderia sp. BCC1630 TaxID=2676304 RepID=UPI001FC7FF3C|nr:methyltransferase domain-containing protein [Burkholderia sp. BCC1630]
MLRAAKDVHHRGDAYLNLACPVCGSLPMPYFQRDTIYIDRCPECRLVYVRNVPSDAALVKSNADYYDNESVRPPGQRLSHHLCKSVENWWHARNLIRCAAGRRSLLEIGYGDGQLLMALKQTRRFDLRGIDRATKLMSYLSANGVDVSQGSLFDQHYPDGRFEFIVGFNILEHVQHLGEFMSEVQRVLAPGGRAYFVVPCVTHFSAARRGLSWKHFRSLDHLWYFSVQAMKRFMSKQGFMVVSAHCISLRAHLTVLVEKRAQSWPVIR